MKTLKKTVLFLSIATEAGLLIFNQLVATGNYPDLNQGLTLLAAYGWLTIGFMFLLAAFAWLFEEPKKVAKKNQSRQQPLHKKQPNAAEWWAHQAERDQFFADLERNHNSLL